jgi:hypothetical protein
LVPGPIRELYHYGFGGNKYKFVSISKCNEINECLIHDASLLI